MMNLLVEAFKEATELGGGGAGGGGGGGSWEGTAGGGGRTRGGGGGGGAWIKPEEAVKDIDGFGIKYNWPVRRKNEEI